MSAGQQHTAGPWRVVNEPTRKDTRLICGGAIHIATVPNQETQGYPDAANARLIAAAPDLLAALQRWEEYALANQYSENEQDSSYCSFLAATRVAISKATS